MAMGTPGVLTRVLGPRYGSAFTFAAPDAATATAPGQLDLSTLRDLYRIETLSQATRIYGVFGKPITSSKSPVMLNAAFAAAGVDAVYLPFETGDAGELFQTVGALNLQGASVTMPLKEQIVPMLEERLTPLAATIGAANTLVRRGRDAVKDGEVDAGETGEPGLEGHNTDAAGIADPLARRTVLEGARILVLGAGGAARAAVFGLRAHGAAVWILNRSAERAEALARAAGATVLTRAEAAAMQFEVVVQATPHGMQNQHVDALMTAAELHTDLFFELVYNTRETPLLQAARERGIRVIDGLEMFLAQGAAQFTLWRGLAAPEAVMREAVLRSMPQV